MAESTPLASPEDVEAALGRDLTTEETARITGILAKASALFRREAGQDFTEGRSEVRLKSNGGRVYLPQRPVTVVHTVVDDCGSAVSYTRHQQWLTTRLPSTAFVTVDYEHGDEEVPDLVRLTVAEVGMKVLGVAAEARQGVASYSETTGPFAESRTYAGWAQGGQTGLSPDDIAIARSFRVRAPSIQVSTPSDSTGDLLGSQLPGLP